MIKKHNDLSILLLYIKGLYLYNMIKSLTKNLTIFKEQIRALIQILGSMKAHQLHHTHNPSCIPQWEF